MEGTRKLAGVIAETVATLEAALVAAADGLMNEAMLELERRVQQIVREVGSVLVSGVLDVRAQGPEGEAGCCPHCAGRLHLVGRERERTLLGLVGEYRFARPTFYCVPCRQGHTPLDAALGLGQVQLAPALAQVVSQEAVQVAFAQASANVQASLGVAVDGETVRRLAEALGALVEQDQADRAQWAVPQAAVPASLLVEFDGVHTPLTDGYREMKVGRVAPLGPDLQEDPQTGRSTLVLGPSCFCAGLEEVEVFYPRLTREAWRAGFTRGVERVVVLADGAKWIWHQAHTQFSHPGVEVIEIVDFYHATEHLAEVATALHGAGTLAATTWFADHKQALWQQGAAPVLASLAACPDLDEPAKTVVRRNRDYFTENTARMDYPAFRARHLPVGSGAVESACKVLISQREKGAGMRWSAAGAQRLASLHALYRSAHERWQAFWAGRPLCRLRALPRPTPTATLAPSAAETPVAPPAPPTLAAAPPPDPVRASAAARIATTGKPWGKGPGYWQRASISHKHSA